MNTTFNFEEFADNMQNEFSKIHGEITLIHGKIEKLDKKNGKNQ